MQTEPPEKINFNGLLTQWKIYDRYQAYEAKKERAEQHQEELKREEKKIRRKFFTNNDENCLELEKKKMFRCCKILERIVNQNNFNDISLGKVLNPKNHFILTNNIVRFSIL